MRDSYNMKAAEKIASIARGVTSFAREQCEAVAAYVQRNSDHAVYTFQDGSALRVDYHGEGGMIHVLGVQNGN